ncbi:MAG: DUF5309 family protein [Arcobacteraceae bacterium]|nr:DUF5309 family protein [Arcobacteraceae bacterium]
MPVGMIYLDDQNTPEKDLVTEMARIGKTNTPFYHLIKKGTPSKKGKAIDGHQWWYEAKPTGTGDNAHIEGGDTANSVDRNLGESKNHYQIIKHKFGVTGSAEGKQDIEGKDEMTVAGVTSIDDHLLDIERIILSDAEPVQRVNTEGAEVAGKLGGVRHWLTAENTVDALNAGTPTALSKKHLRDMFKIGWKQGVITEYVFMNDAQKDKLDEIDTESSNSIYGKKDLRVNDYQTIKNFTYAKDVQVILTPHLPQDMILGVNADSLALVHQRLSKIETLGKTGDSIKKTIITELTLRINNPYGVTAITGLEE